MKLMTARDEPMTRSNLDDFEHDAMAAHALLQAMEQWGKHPGYQGGESWVMNRADELMREWTKQDEVAK